MTSLIPPRQSRRGIAAVLEHGRYVLGPEVQELEERLADYTGARYCVSVGSGTDALLIALMALGVGPGDEVITTPFTFIATGEVIALVRSRPVYVDIDPRTFNLYPALLEQAIGPNTKAIMPVSLYGQCTDLTAINRIAEKHGLPVIEDAAQSFSATHRGRRSCSLSRNYLEIRQSRNTQLPNPCADQVHFPATPHPRYRRPALSHPRPVPRSPTPPLRPCRRRRRH